jgi:hypothetical protein
MQWWIEKLTNYLSISVIQVLNDGDVQMLSEVH